MIDKRILLERRERHKPIALETIRSAALSSSEPDNHTNPRTVADILGVDLSALAEMMGMVGLGHTS